MTDDQNITKSEEKLLILPLGEESRKITQVISNDTARQIIELLADAPLSASDIAEHLHAPLTTIAYNLDNLESVGLIRIEKIKYSEKGREVKIYAPVRKVIVVVPEKIDQKSVTDMLRRYLGVILAAVLASGMIEFLARNTANKAASPVMISESSNMIADEAARSQGMTTAINATMPPVSPVSTESVAAGNISLAEPSYTSDLFARISDAITGHPGVIFLLGCLFAVALIMISDHFRKKNRLKS